jgi:hypothetical protein
MGPVDVVAESEVARLRRELERLRAENVRLSRLLDLRGQDTAPAPEQLSAAVAQPGLVLPPRHEILVPSVGGDEFQDSVVAVEVE